MLPLTADTSAKLPTLYFRSILLVMLIVVSNVTFDQVLRLRSRRSNNANFLTVETSIYNDGRPQMDILIRAIP